MTTKSRAGRAKEKEPKKAELLDVSKADEVNTIVSTIDLDELKLKKKKWTAKLVIGTTIPKTFQIYRINLDLNEKPFKEKVLQLEKDLDDSLFRKERVSRKATNKKIGDVQSELEQMRRDCPHIEFIATVDSLAYKDGDTKLVVRIPDDAVDPLNKQKFRFEAYQISLVPIFTSEKK